MATIEAALICHLLRAPRVADLVVDRINLAGDVPQGQATPYIVIRKLGGDERVRSLKGFTGLVRSRVQVECYDATAADAIRVREAVKRACDGVRGPLGDPADAVVVQSMAYDDDFQSEERVTSGKGNDEILQTADLVVWFEKGKGTGGRR